MFADQDPGRQNIADLMDPDPKQFTTWAVGIRRAGSIFYYSNLFIDQKYKNNK